MNIKLVAFGIAKDILKATEVDYSIPDASAIKSLKQALVKDYPEFDKLSSLRFAINEDYQEDDFILSEKDEVVIIPPVSGG